MGSSLESSSAAQHQSNPPRDGIHAFASRSRKGANSSHARRSLRVPRDQSSRHRRPGSHRRDRKLASQRLLPSVSFVFSSVASFLSKDLPHALSPNDIFMTAGCSQAIQFSIAALANSERASNMLIPRPGFPLYQSFCSFYGVECREYDLLPSSDWEIDLRHVEKLADDETVAIVLCNPGNPCGSVYGSHHLKQVAKLAGKLRVPIIADEIYAHMVFQGSRFVPMGAFASQVPVLTVGGISKRWFVPGWRLGWISVNDPDHILRKAKILDAINNLAQMHLSTCTPIQAALPKILDDTPPTFFTQTLTTLQIRAELCYRRSQEIVGLSCPSKPRGAMYIMVKVELDKFKDFKNDKEFATALTIEEAVGVLPGSAFGYPGWIRLLVAAPEAQLNETWDRVEAFFLELLLYIQNSHLPHSRRIDIVNDAAITCRVDHCR